MYRVICKSKFFGSESEKIIWEGKDLVELSKKYPPSKIFRANPFCHKEFEDGYIVEDYHFEKLEGGEWVKISDPRKRIDERLTQHEIETERENRRMFPGDHV